MSLNVEAPYQIFNGLDGLPLTNGQVYIGTINLDPVVNPIATFWDQNLTIPAAQPLLTNAGYIVRAGTPARVYVAGNYSISVKQSNGVLVYTNPDATGTGGVNYVQQGTGFGQNNNTVKIGNTSAGRVRMTVDTTDLGFLATSTQDTQFTAVQTFLGGATVATALTITAPNNAQIAFQNNAGVRTIVLSTDTFIFLSNANAPVAQIDNSGNISANSFITTSDARLKTNWRPMPSDAISKFAKLKRGFYNWITGGEDEIGITAQGLRKIFPEAVRKNKSGTLGISASGITLAMVAELCARVEEQEKRIAKLERKP